MNTNNKAVSNVSEDIGETRKAMVKKDYKNIKPGTLQISVTQFQLHVAFGQDGMIFFSSEDMDIFSNWLPPSSSALF